jgi:hypothetical protein
VAAHHPRAILRLRHARRNPRVPPATCTAHRAYRTSQPADLPSLVTRASARLLLNHCTARSRLLPARRLVRRALSIRHRRRTRVIRASCRTKDRDPDTILPAAIAKRSGRLMLATLATPLRRLIRSATAGYLTLANRTKATPMRPPQRRDLFNNNDWGGLHSYAYTYWEALSGIVISSSFYSLAFYFGTWHRHGVFGTLGQRTGNM